jgi:hypothetical protein
VGQTTTIYAPLLITLAVCAAGCGRAESYSVSHPLDDVSPLSGGTENPTLVPLSSSQVRAIGRIETTQGDRRCTGFLVGARHVLSAGHCFPAEQPEGYSGAGRLPEVLQFRPGGSLTPVPIMEVYLHPTLDMALCATGAALPSWSTEPLLLREPLAAALVPGQRVEAAGAGRGTPTAEGPSFGVFELDRVTAVELEMHATDGAGLCRGDSGGPVFASGEVSVAAVHVRGYDDCTGPSFSIPVDPTWTTAQVQEPFTDATPCTEGVPSQCVDNQGWNCLGGWWRVVPCNRLPGHACHVLLASGTADCLPIPCGDATPTGTCWGGVAVSCQFGARVEEDCTAMGMACILVRSEGRVGCVPCDSLDGGCTPPPPDGSVATDVSWGDGGPAPAPGDNPRVTTGCPGSSLPGASVLLISCIPVRRWRRRPGHPAG